MQHGKITTESLNIISTRPATKSERSFFDPIKTGKRYAILMMIAFSYIPFLIADASAIVWGAYYLSILLLGFYFWLRSLTRARLTFNVFRINGEFDEVIKGVDGRHFLKIKNVGEMKGRLGVLLPDIFKDKLSRIPLNSPITFEMNEKDTALIGIDRVFSLNSTFEAKTNKKHFPWMIVTLTVLIFNIIINFDNLKQVELVMNMIKVSGNPEIEMSNSLDNNPRIGQKIKINNIIFHCALDEGERIKEDLKNIHCNEFYVSDSLSSEPNWIGLASNTLVELKTINNTLSIPVIDDFMYRLVSLGIRKNNFSGYDGIPKQNDILKFNYSVLHKWAVWLDDNEIKNVKAQSVIIKMWRRIEDTLYSMRQIDERNSCINKCWETILKYNDTGQFDNVGNLSKYRGNMSVLLNIKDDYVKARVEALLSIWDRSIPSERISNVKVRFLDSNNEEIYWNNILDAVSSTSKHYSVNEYIEMITNTAERLKKNYIHGIEYAVIQDIEEKNGIQTLIIDMRMNERSYFIYITQLGIILIALIMMLFTVIKYKKRNRNVMHDQL